MMRETLGVKRQTWVRTFCLSTVASLLCLLSEQAQAFKIIEPAEGAKLTSGTTVTARVDLGKDSGIVQVRYYWYGEEDETLVEQEDATATGSIIAPVALIGQADHDPAFGGTLRVPKDGIGPMRLLAVAEISRGRLGTRSVFDEILVNVEPAASLATIVLTLLGSGAILIPSLVVAAVSWDRVAWALRADAGPVAVALLTLVFVAAWGGGLVLAGATAAWRSLAWTAEVLRADGRPGARPRHEAAGASV